MHILFIFLNLLFSFLSVNCTEKSVETEKMRLKKCECLLKRYFIQADNAREENLFYGYMPELDIAEKTYTLFGKLTLQKIVTDKHIHKEIAKTREDFLLGLIDKPELMHSLENFLHEIAKSQDLFLTYFDQDSTKHEKLSACFFGPYLAQYGFNESPLALKLKQQFSKSLVMATTGLIAYAPLFFGAAFNYRIAQIRTEEDKRDSSISWSTIFKNSFMLPLRSIDPRLNVYKDGYFNEKIIDKSAVTKGDQAVIWSQDYELPLSFGYLACYAQAAGFISSGCVTAKNSYDYIVYKNKQLTTLTDEIKTIQSLTIKAYAFVGQEPRIALDNHYNTSIGSVLIMHNQLKNNRLDLIDIFKLFGELDACHALARNMLDTTEVTHD